MSQLQKQILDIARQQYVEKGEAGVSLRGIAKELGVTHPAIYTYFQSKEQLMLKLKYSVFKQLKNKLFAEVTHETNLQKSVQQLADSFVEFVETNPAYFRLLFFRENDSKNAAIQLQILEFIDELLPVTSRDVNIPQIFWYALIGHTYAYCSGEITKNKKHELVTELVERISH